MCWAAARRGGTLEKPRDILEYPREARCSRELVGLCGHSRRTYFIS